LRRADYLYANAAALISGACLMVMEIVASRVLAPAFGNTVFLWSSVIGLIMAALSLGYWLGGVLADRRPRLETLAGSLALSGLLVGAVPLLSTTVLETLGPDAGLIRGPIFATALLFLAPGVLMGTVSPIAVKLVALGGSEVGHASGRVSALGALGSIAGTFGAGFVLIPAWGNRAILVGIAITLALLALVGFALARAALARPIGATLATLLLCLAAGTSEAETSEDVLFDRQTFYHRVRVTDEPWGEQRVRVLTLDTTNEGAMFLEGDGLPFRYTQFIDTVDLFTGSPRSAAFVGGGSFAMPKRFLERHEGGAAFVYELDPVVVEVGERFFRTRDVPGLEHRVGDARQLLRASNERFDLIFGDAYNGIRAVPAHLATLEYYRIVRDHLTVGGVYMTNIIASLSGSHAGFFHSTARTLREVFPELYVFAVRNPRDRRRPQNMVLVCPVSPRELTPAEIRFLGAEAGLEELTDGVVDLAPFEDAIDAAPILTDDHSPVEVLVME
jgi:spermidine synthase